MARSLYQRETEKRISQLVAPVVQEMNLELVELQFVPQKSRSLLRLLLDRPGGVTIAECAEISKRVSFILETEDPIENRYVLEVSSPGLDRALTTPDDFRRKVGERIRVYTAAGDKPRELEGELLRIDSERLYLKSDGGDLSIALADVVKGKIIY
jgi:ribosome maturation factor RimP